MLSQNSAYCFPPYRTYHYAAQPEKAALPNERVYAFGAGINAILTRCGLSEIYPPAPYEALLEMCAATEHPAEVLAEITEMAYQK